MTKAILFATLLGLLLTVLTSGVHGIEESELHEVARTFEGILVTGFSTEADEIPEEQEARSPHDQIPLQPFYETIVNGDYVSASVGLRQYGQGDICITGMPDCPTIEKAFLFWTLLSDICPPPANIVFEGHPIVGNLVAVGGDPCWKMDASYVYVADVTNYVDENGCYHVSGLPFNVPYPLSEGAGLVVIYSTPLSPPRAVTIYAGANTANGQIGFPLRRLDLCMNVEPICKKSYSKTTFLVADSQAASDYAYFNNFKLDGNDVFYVEYFQAVTFDVTPLVSAGDTVVKPSIEMGSDCLTWSAQVFSAPYCSFPCGSGGCCDYIREQIDLLVFVAKNRVSTGCSHINDIFQSPPAACWDNAITTVCETPTKCGNTLQNYKASVATAKSALTSQCYNLNKQIEAAAAAAKALLGSSCTEEEGRKILTKLGYDIDCIVNSMDLSDLESKVLTKGHESLNTACTITKSWLCSAYFTQCDDANCNAMPQAEHSIKDITDIVDAQVVVGLSGLPIRC